MAKARFSLGRYFHGLMRFRHSLLLELATCRLAGPWQLSQPTSFRCAVVFSLANPETIPKPTVWQTIHSGSYWRLPGCLASTRVWYAWLCPGLFPAGLFQIAYASSWQRLHFALPT